MILLVVNAPYEVYQNSNPYTPVKALLERLSRDACLMIHYTMVNRGLLLDIRPWAICHSGGTGWEMLEKKNYRRCITRWDTAQLGICKGHQVVAKAFGGKIGLIRKLAENEPDPDPHWHPGEFKESGMTPVHIDRKHPLFKGLAGSIMVAEAHRFEIKELAADLIPLASSEHCKVQAFVHRRKPVYGVQFHPERADEKNPAGFKVLKNFFREARIYQKAKTSATNAQETEGILPPLTGLPPCP